MRAPLVFCCLLPAFLLQSRCAAETHETPDYCGMLFSYWGVDSVECSEDCDYRNTVLIMRRNNVVTTDGSSVAGSTRGFIIEIDKTHSAVDQLSIALHELGHVLLGPGHSENPDDVMFPYFQGNRDLKYPSAREFILARELWVGKKFQCRFIP